MNLPNPSPSLILLRGLPGAGKSTLAAELSENGKYPVFSVDDFFTDGLTGEYRFDHTQNHLAYRQCLTHTRDALLSGAQKVIVHNTFTIDWEMEPYLKTAAEFNCRLHVVTVEKYHKGENIHGISPEQLEKMAAKYKVKLL